MASHSRISRQTSVLTSKERVRKAFSHQEPDRVPIDYLYNPGIDARLKDYFGLEADDDEGLRQELGVDFREIAAPYVGPELHPPLPDRRINVWGIRTRWIEHQSGGYWDYCDFPLREATVEEVEAWPMPSPDDYDYSVIPDLCRQYEDYAVVIGDPGYADMINTTGMIRTMEQALVDFFLDEPAALRFIDRRNAIQIEVLRRTLEAARGGVDILWIGEDLGTQKGPMISQELYDRHFRHRHQLFVDLGKEFDVSVMFHSCGSSSWIFDTLIGLGVSIMDTLQPEAAKMDPSFLKSRFGQRLSFHGCISTAGPVAYGTPEETRENVRATLEIMKPGGGYALAPTHMLQDNSPTENVVALYQAAHDFGSY